jgi:hypothetical protein
VRSSTGLLEQYKALEEAAGRGNERTVMAPKTRWLYTYDMLQRLIDSRSTIDEMCGERQWSALSITE